MDSLPLARWLERHELTCAGKFTGDCVELTCSECGDTFYVRRHEKKAQPRRGKFCSDSCRQTHAARELKKTAEANRARKG